MNLIKEIHNYLAEDIEQLNKLIISHLAAKEDLIELVSKHLIEGRGKRIRPLLTILVSRMFGYEAQAHIRLATAVEFIHTATLLHDDVVDDSKMRRFKPTANIIWGNKASILVGDFLFSQSFKLMVSVKSIPALESLSKASSIIAEGEVSQLAKLNQRRIITFDEYQEIILAKTAELFGAACEVGAIISGQNNKICNALSTFGINLGNIFQIADDLLDYTSSDGEIGKNIGDDFLEGKVTLPLILLCGKLESVERQQIIEMIESNERTPQDFIFVQERIEKYEIKKQIMHYLNDLITHTISLLQQDIPDNKYKEFLLSLVSFAMNRTY